MYRFELRYYYLLATDFLFCISTLQWYYCWYWWFSFLSKPHKWYFCIKKLYFCVVYDINNIFFANAFDRVWRSTLTCAGGKERVLQINMGTSRGFSIVIVYFDFKSCSLNTLKSQKSKSQFINYPIFQGFSWFVLLNQETLQTACFNLTLILFIQFRGTSLATVQPLFADDYTEVLIAFLVYWLSNNINNH